MAQIVERIFTYVPAKALVLNGEQWSRKIALGNQWSRIRMGFLGAIQGTESFVGYLLLGMSNGPTGGAAVGGSAIGASFTGGMDTGAGAWTYQSNTSNAAPYFSGGSGKVFRRLPAFPGAFGASISTDTSSSISQVNLAAASLGYAKRRTPLYFDITRDPGGGGTATVAVYGFSSTNITLDYRPDHFLDGLDQPGIPNIYGLAMTQLLSTTIPVSDMLGALDTMFLMWQMASVGLEVYAIGATVVRQLDWEAGIGGAADISSNYSFVGTATADVLTNGSGFAAQGVFSGTYTNPQVISGYAGTCGFPFDPFLTYAAGTAVSGVTISNGSGWASAGVF